MIIIGIVLLLITLALFIGGTIVKKNGNTALVKAEAKKDSWAESEARDTLKWGKRLKRFAIIPLALLIISALVSGIRIVDTTEIGVVKTFGEINYTIDGGLNLVNPFTDTVSFYDLKTHVAQAEFSSYTKDAQPLTATIETQFSIMPDGVMEVARAYGSQEMMESKLANLIEEKTKVVFAKYSAMSLLENRANLSAEVEQELTHIEEMFHINFTSAIIRDIDFSDSFETSVEQKMMAEQKALKAEQEKKEAVIKAEQVEEVAKIEARAKVAEAQGEADAMKITKEALASMPEAYIQQMYLEKWDGKLPQIVSEDSNLMLTPNLG